VRCAQQPGQALNIDLCFVPESHTAQDRLPAVSGSSGHLVIEWSARGKERPHWPGQVFADAELSYEDAMQQYVQATQDRLVQHRLPKSGRVEEPSRWQAVRQEQVARYQVMLQRKQEEVAWKAAKNRHRQARLVYAELAKEQRTQQQAACQVELTAWTAFRQQRHSQLQVRKAENKAWHRRNRLIKEGPNALVQDRSWIAILVVTDNCTRQCLGLPIFRTGAKVTGQEVITALSSVLPAQLQFLISDQGKDFRNQLMAQLAREKEFLQVLVYRHRPQSNGIAERFVLTLKDWLRSLSWQGGDELEGLVQRFQPEYNDRPHQGLAIPGLSPNELALRIWLM
jgi:transposase InsO family protein